MELHTPPPVAAPQPAANTIDQTTLQLVDLIHRQRSGADWFFWIAGLSIVNSLVALAALKVNFPIGLGITQIIDGIPAEFHLGTGAKIIALFFNILIAGFYVMLGIFARKRQMWSFILGMILYLIDGMIFFAGPDWFSIAFHAYALWCLYNGMTLTRELNNLAAPRPAANVTPPPIVTNAMPPPFISPHAMPAPPPPPAEPAEEPAPTPPANTP